MTYLQIVNSILTRLRENTVATVTATSYSSLIATYVNDIKKQVEDAYNWDALEQTITVTTSSGTSTYTVTGSGRRPKDITVNDTTNQSQLHNVPLQWILDQQQLSTVQNGNPIYYAWNGWTGTDSKVEFYPTPDGTYSIKFNMNVPQADLSDGSDVLLIPECPVILGAYARAVAERGEDGGLASSEAYGLYKSALSDAIAVESTRFIENDCFVAI